MKLRIRWFWIFKLMLVTMVARADLATQVVSPCPVDRDLFALDRDGDRVVARKPDGKWTTVFQRKGCSPSNLVTSSGGELALACEAEKSIVLFRVDGQVHRVIHADADGEPLLPPQRLVFASDGSVFFTASRPLRAEGASRGGLYWIPAGHKNAWSISSSLAFPQGLLIEKDLQHVVVAERMSGRVVRYTLHGSARSYNRRLRKPQVLFDFKKAAGTGTDVLSPGPSALAWASDTSFWVSFIGDSSIREIRIEDGQVVQTVTLPSQATRVSHLHPDRIQKVLWLSTEKGLESVPIPANPNPASP